MRSYHSGEICFFDDMEVNFRAEIQFNDYHRGIITIYGVTREVFLAAEHGEYNSAVMLLENKEYISVFDLYIRKGTSNTKLVDGEPIFDAGTIVIESSTILKGKKFFSQQNTFRELLIEITDGCELIGLCPYDLNKNYVDILMYENIEIPVKMTTVHVNTVSGEFWFSVFPQYEHSKDTFSLGFTHRIQFKPVKALKIIEIREVLNRITSFFTLLCGESVSINKLTMMETEDPNNDTIDFIGICNFTKEKLDALDNSGIDTTNFKRISVFKVSDFSDLEYAMNYWFEHYDPLFNAQKAYDRILLDEELRVITINKFLAAMQLIEGYTQAYVDDKREREDFEKQKRNIISKLTETDEIELVQNGLGFSGVSFRKAVKEYLYKGCNCLEDISKNAFLQKNKELIDKIVNDRNVYTHSSNRAKPQLNFNEMINVAVVCKQIYRILLLNEMRIPHSLLIQRIAYSRSNMAIFERVLGINLSMGDNIPEFDSAMCNFVDSK